jgi:hypothetical protein
MLIAVASFADGQTVVVKQSPLRRISHRLNVMHVFKRPTVALLANPT